MPISSRGNVPAGTIRELGLPGRAVSALTHAGVTRIEALAGLTQRDLAAVPGLGPGMIAAIRLVVPEPATRAARSAAAPDPDDGPLALPGTRPEPGPDQEEWPAAPVMPSFDSLRGPRRRSAVDLLLPDLPPATEAAAPAVPRPAEYADLLLLAVRGIRGVADVAWRVARWMFRGPGSCLHRLLGDEIGAPPRAGGNSRPERR
jgi:hypothetical protein